MAFTYFLFVILIFFCWNVMLRTGVPVSQRYDIFDCRIEFSRTDLDLTVRYTLNMKKVNWCVTWTASAGYICRVFVSIVATANWNNFCSIQCFSISLLFCEVVLNVKYLIEYCAYVSLSHCYLTEIYRRCSMSCSYLLREFSISMIWHWAISLIIDFQAMKTVSLLPSSSDSATRSQTVSITK